MSWLEIVALLILSPLILAVAFLVIALIVGSLPPRRLRTPAELAEARKRAQARELEAKRWSQTARFFADQPGGTKAERYEDIVRFRQPGRITRHDLGHVVAEVPGGGVFVWSDGAIVEVDRDGREVERHADDWAWLASLEQRKQAELAGELFSRVADAERLHDWDHLMACIGDARRLDALESAPASEAPDDVLAWAKRERTDIAWGPLDSARHPLGDPENFPTCMHGLLEEQPEDEPRIDPDQLEFLGTPDVGSYSGHLFRDHSAAFVVYEMYVDRYHYASPEVRYESAAAFARGVVLLPRLERWFQPWRLRGG